MVTNKRINLKSRKYKKNNYRKRKYLRGNRRRYNTKMRMYTQLVPAYFDMKLKYGIPMTTIVHGALDTQYDIFRGNGMYDPEHAVGGHQPKAFDQMCLFYRNYLVFASKIAITFFQFNAFQNGIFFIQPSTQVTAAPGDISTYIDLQEGQRIKYRNAMAGAYDNITSVTVGGGHPSQKTHIKHYMKTKTIFGLAKLSQDSQDYTGAEAQDPTYVWYWRVGELNTNRDDSYYNGVITYYARFFNRKEL